MDVSGHVLLVGRHHILLPQAAGPGNKFTRFGDYPEALDLLPENRIRSDADFKSVVFRGVMAGGDHDPAFGLQGSDGEI